MRPALTMVALLGVLAGCFAAPELESCAVDSDCPGAYPRCRDGLCFHYSVEFLRPLCTPAAPAGTACCEVTVGDGSTAPGGCLLASFQAAGATLSAPALNAAGTVAYTAVKGGELTVARLAPPYREGDLWQGALSGQESASAPAPLLHPDGSMVVVTPSRVLFFGPAAGNPFLQMVVELPCAAVGLAASPIPGQAWVSCADSLVQVGVEGKVGPQPLAVGAVGPGLGPLVAGEVVAAPLLDGQAVALRSRSDPAVSLGSLEGQELPGGLAGMALDPSGYLYALSLEGIVQAVCLASLPASTNSWSNPLPMGKVRGGPLVTRPGEVAVLLADGDFKLLSRERRHDPQRVTTAGPVLFLSPLAHDGFMLIFEGSEGPRLSWWLSWESLPWEESWEKLGRFDWPVLPGAVGAAGPSAGGVVAVTTGEALLLFSGAERLREQALWPGPRGPGNLGAME